MKLYELRELVPVELVLSLIVSYIAVLPVFLACWIWSVVSLFLSPHVYQAVNDILCAAYLRFDLFFVENLVRTKMFLHGDVKEFLSRKERVLCFSNHQSAMDWRIMNMLAARQGCLGNIRFVLKNSLQWAPLFGYMVYMHSCIFVNRRSFKASKFLAILKHLRDKKISSWFVIYPEGTRYSKETLEKAKKYAENKGLTPFQHVLIPKYRGFHLVCSNLRSNLDAVYDITVIYSCTKGSEKGIREEAPSFSEYLSGCCDEVHIHIKRINIMHVPTDEEAVKQWLNELFREKDSLLEDFYNKDLPLPSNHPLGNGIVSRKDYRRNRLGFLCFALLTVPFFTSWNGIVFFFNALLFGTFVSLVWKITDILRYQLSNWKQD